jgi:hypothetical protein
MKKLTPEQRLAQNAAIARSQFASKQVQRQQTKATQQQFLAENQGWDADRGAYACKLPDGTIVYADSITTGIAAGLVSIYIPASGRAVIDAMP